VKAFHASQITIKEDTFMFKPKLWQSHDEDRTIAKTYSRRLSHNPKYTFKSYEKEYRKLLGLNLDAIAEFIPGLYSATGHPAKKQVQVLRSLILLSCSSTALPQGPASLYR
jgi:hypothetical protein